MDVYQYDEPFRRKIVSLLLNRSWMARYGAVLISPKYFPLKEEQDVVEAIRTFYDKYRRTPDEADLHVLVDYEYTEYIDALFQLDQDTSLASDLVIEWAKQQAAKIAVLDSVEDIRKGDLQKVQERLREAIRVGQSVLSPGIDLVEDISTWLNHDTLSDKIPTGWLHFDLHMDGGLGRGELTTVMGPSNRGKSMALLNMAYGAAGLGSAKNVALFTHELAPNVYAKRFGARMLYRFPKRSTDLIEYEVEFMAHAKMLLPGKVRIIGGIDAHNTNDIEAHLKRLQEDGFEIGLVIDDYPDLIPPMRSRKDRRFELSDIYTWLRMLGSPGYISEEGFPTVGATQTGRGSYDKEIITEKDVAEDIGKVSISDNVIALCQTKEEALQERCRLYLAKVRDGKRGVMFDAKFYSDSQAIVTTGITRRKKDEREL